VNSFQGMGDGSLRALLLGPAFTPGQAGGLQIALGDLASELASRGWMVDSQIWTAAAPLAQPASGGGWLSSYSHSKLSGWQRSPRLLAFWMNAVPAWLRGALSMACMPRAYWENVGHNLRLAERRLAEAQTYDAILLCVDGAPPGLSALAAARHKRVALISLSGLETELKANWWRWERRLVQRRLRGRAHPFLLRPIASDQIGLAIFASDAWQAGAVRAGLPPHKARTIYFGIPLPEARPRSSQTGHRILWAGRLSAEKGLHLLLRAMPIVRQRIGDARLTIIAGAGSSGYRRMILRMIEELDLGSIVTMLPPVERAALHSFYASHDVLFFHSIYSEPVALVLMEAFAAGLPVVASQADSGPGLIRHDVTCLCYQPGSARSLAAALSAMLSDADLRQRLAGMAQQFVRQEFSLAKMGREYDEALREYVGVAQGAAQDAPSSNLIAGLAP
jgi:glycosyltransferase involved in cell wall biosynthesis